MFYSLSYIYLKYTKIYNIHNWYYKFQYLEDVWDKQDALNSL